MAEEGGSKKKAEQQTAKNSLLKSGIIYKVIKFIYKYFENLYL